MTQTEFALWMGIAGTFLIVIGMGLLVIVNDGYGAIFTGIGAGLLGWATVKIG